MIKIPSKKEFFMKRYEHLKFTDFSRFYLFFPFLDFS